MAVSGQIVQKVILYLNFTTTSLCNCRYAPLECARSWVSATVGLNHILLNCYVLHYHKAYRIKEKEQRLCGSESG